MLETVRQTRQKRKMTIFSRKGSQGKDGYLILNRYPIQKRGDQRTPNKTKEKGQLDYQITRVEIKLGAYILHNGIATGHDSISNEILMSPLNIQPGAIKALFNMILQRLTITHPKHL